MDRSEVVSVLDVLGSKFRVNCHAARVQHSMSAMNQIELEKVKEFLAPDRCQRCGRPMRLIGSEPHPVEAGTDLLTYACTTCDEYFVRGFGGPHH